MAIADEAKIWNHKRVELRAAVEQIEQRALHAEHGCTVYKATMFVLGQKCERAEQERDAERDGRDAMDSAARCNHKAYEQEREARLRAEQEAAAYRKVLLDIREWEPAPAWMRAEIDAALKERK